LPEFVRIVIPVDPSGSGDEDNAGNDAIGIMVCALGTDGIGYLLEDLTVKAGPGTWGKVATTAYERWEANGIVGETNYGGEMVRFVIQTARPHTPFIPVTASRGKHVRAEPISALYEQGRIRHVGHYPELEEEYAAFTVNGFSGPDSPNRADAAIWGFTELFAGIVAPQGVKKFDRAAATSGGSRWAN
jgi:phage terminase large subunit-like protein